MIRSTFIFILALLFLLAPMSPLGAQEIFVLGTDLEPKVAQFDAVSLEDEGLLRLRISSGPLTPLNDKQYVATLVDGQVLVGTLLGAGKDGESIRLAFGFAQRTVVLPLDELLSFTLVGHQLTGDENDDKLLLATGETLVGFVDAIGEKSIGFVIGDADDPIQVPMARVRGFSIANQPKPIKPEKGLARVQLRGGSSVYLRDSSLKRAAGQTPAAIQGTLVVEPETKAVALPLNHVQFIEPMSGQVALQSLAEIEIMTIDGGEVFGVTMLPSISADGAIHLHAPITVGFGVPDTARRLAFTAAMDLDDTVPESRRPLAGCELVVYDGDEPIARHTLTPDGPAKRLNLPLTGGDLRLVLESGVNGPVLDRVILTDAQLLVSE